MNRFLLFAPLSILMGMVLFQSRLAAQQLYWVQFNCTKSTHYNPWYELHESAIDRRIRECISLDDSTDAPINPCALETCRALADTVLLQSRWLNGVAAVLDASALRSLRQYEFVKGVYLIPKVQSQLAAVSSGHSLDNDSLQNIQQSELLIYQTERMGCSLFHQNNIKGKDVRIAVFDVGFRDANVSKGLEHLFLNNQIIHTWDVVSNKPVSYKTVGNHGTMVLSCIAGMDGTQPSGAATEAKFLLARTEQQFSEWNSEELNWIAAAEWADKNGVDIINSSLGYTNSRYFPEDMDGQHSLIARAASEVVRKGIFVVNSAGNDGDSPWRTLATPADAVGVLTVGGTNPYSDIGIDFSSRGPTRDGRLKPELSAPAQVRAASGKGWTTTFGTSFSAPLVSGFVACVKQMNPDWTQSQLFDSLLSSGHLYPYFDYQHGYGVPQANRFVKDKSTKAKLDIKTQVEGDFFSLVLPAEANLDQASLLFYNVADEEGKILVYSVLKVETYIPFTFNIRFLAPGQILNIHYEGQTISYPASQKP